MKRLNGSMAMILVSISLLLTSCAARNESMPEASTPSQNMGSVMDHPKMAYKDEKFEMKLNVNKSVFKVGEPILCSASLTYVGDQSSILIWGPRSYIVFSISDGKKFKMEGVSTAELTSTTLNRGETQEVPFIKSGAYLPDAPDAGFWKKFFTEKDLLLPKGTYLISASSNFSLTEKVIDSHYNGEVHTTITVE